MSQLRGPVMIGVAVVVAAAVIGGGWWLMNRSGAKPAAPGTSASAADPSKTNAVTPVDVPKADGDGFLGSWFPEDTSGTGSNNDLLTITRQGPLLVGLGRKPSDGRIELKAAAGSKLSGEYVEEGGKRTPVTAELLSDGQKMVLILLPPASEPDTVVMIKVKPDELQDAVNADSPASGGPITEEKARQLVAASAEVSAFIKLLQSQGKTPHLDVSPEDDKTFMVHVYEIVDDGDGMSHTATQGWYKVDRATGAISPGM